MNTISIRRGRGSLDCCCFGACEPCAKAVSVSDTKHVMFTIAHPRKVTNHRTENYFKTPVLTLLRTLTGPLLGAH